MTRPVPTIVINAAGRGARLGLGMPKCLIEVGGRTILEHQLAMLQPFADVRVVVGYRADDVTAVANRVRKDLTYVFNPRYERTGTLSSLYLGARFAPGDVVSLDGDLLVRPDDFLEFCRQPQPTAGVCIPHTDEPVFAQIRSLGEQQFVTRFSTDPIGMEWTGLLKAPAFWIEECGWHVYECAEKYLPLRAMRVEACEVDTPADYARAQQWIEQQSPQTFPCR